jgi:hypothetical protein
MNDSNGVLTDRTIDGEAMTRLAWALAERGTAGVEHDLQALAAQARRVGVRPVAAGVLADQAAPEVVRLRAFSLVASALDAVARTAGHDVAPSTHAPILTAA